MNRWVDEAAPVNRNGSKRNITKRLSEMLTQEQTGSISTFAW
jgi:hypothetical protein